MIMYYTGHVAKKHQKIAFQNSTLLMVNYNSRLLLSL